MNTAFVKQKTISFPISLVDLDKVFSNNFGRLVLFDHGQGESELPLYWCWVKASEEEIGFYFRQELSVEEDALFESIWSSLDSETEAQKMNALNARPIAIDNAKLAAATSSWDQLTPEQRKIIIGAPLTEADVDQLVEDFGNL